MNPNHTRDENDRRTLYELVWKLLSLKAETDGTLQNFVRRPTMFSLTMNAHQLIYAFGASDRIADGEIRWQPNPDGDKPRKFSVRRGVSRPDLFRLNEGDELDLDGIAERIVDEYLGPTAG